jgi:hypothetical protein
MNHCTVLSHLLRSAAADAHTRLRQPVPRHFRDHVGGDAGANAGDIALDGPGWWDRRERDSGAQITVSGKGG